MDRWWRINKTLVAKLQATGYEIPAEALAQVASAAAFATAFPFAVGDPSTMERVFMPRVGTMAEQRSPNGVALLFSEVEPERKTIVTGQVERVVGVMAQQQVSTGFYVVNGPFYHVAAARLRSIAPIYRVVTFRQEQLTFNITQHKRAPKHELLTPAEASKWLVTTGLKRSQHPRIYEDDPFAKYLDALPGDIIRVTNPSPTVGQFVRHLAVVRRLGR